MNKEEVFSMLSRILLGNAFKGSEYYDFVTTKVDLNEYIKNLKDEFKAIKDSNISFKFVAQNLVFVNENGNAKEYMLTNSGTVSEDGEMSVADVLLTHEDMNLLPFYKDYPQFIEVCLNNLKPAKQINVSTLEGKLSDIANFYGISETLVSKLLGLNVEQLEGVEEMVELLKTSKKASSKPEKKNAGQMGE